MPSGNYPSDWDQRRRRVYRRDEFACSNCGRKGGSKGDTELHAHHIVPIKSGGSHKISNLVTLCKGCHKSIHTGSKAPTDSVNHCVADTVSAEGAVNAMTISVRHLFDEVVTLTQTMDSITIVPEGEKIDILSKCTTTFRRQIPQVKNNLNQIENNTYIQSKGDELPVLVEHYVNTHREMISFTVELIDAIDEASEIFEITRQAKCPNCPVGEVLINGTCRKCGTALEVSDDSVWRRYRDNRKRMNNISSRFVQQSEDVASAADALTGYFE